MGLFSFTQELAMDLGTANTIITCNDKMVVDEPSVIALDARSEKVLAVGRQAREMYEKTNPNIRTIRPLREGVIADFYAAEQMMRGLIKMASGRKRWFAPSLRMVIGIPSGSTEVEIRAVRDSAEHAGGREVYMVFEPMAAAIGVGMDVLAPEGNMIVDIGGGTTEIAVISLGGIVIEFVDIAGLVKGASQGAGLGNKFLENIRRTDAIVHVVRCFDDENIMHVVADASTNVPVDPIGDIETIDLELIMADLEMVNRRVEKAAKMAKGDKKFLHEADVFKALAAHLDAGKSARTFEADSKEDAELIATADLLSLKPIIYAANMDEDGFADKDSNKYYKLVADLAAKEGAEVLPICAKLEQDIAELDGDDRAMFLEELGIEKSGLDRLIQCSYTLLGLISFLTYGEDECRAWTIVKGTKAPQAAGKIHSDIERGFIRAETINFSEMIACGSVAAAKEKGLLRSEGKDYVVKDGDMIYFRFNV